MPSVGTPTFALPPSNAGRDLRDKVCSNFKGVNMAPNHLMDLFNYKQGEREPLQEYWLRFIQLRACTPNIIDKVVILATVNGQLSRHYSSRLTRKLATIVAVTQGHRKILQI